MIENEKRNSAVLIIACVCVVLFNILLRFASPFGTSSPTISILKETANQNENYISYHNRTNDNSRFPEWIEYYNNFTDSPDTDSTKYLIYQCHKSCGGIGDRLHGIISLYYIALITKRKFIIDSPNPYPLINMLIPNKVNWTPTNDIYKSSKSKKFIGSIDRYTKTLKHPHELDKYQTVSVKFNLLRFPDILYDKPELKHLKTEEQKENLLFKWAFFSLFKRSPALVQAINNTKSSLGLNNQNYISMHVRIGNDADATWKDPARHSIQDIDTFLDCAHRIRNISSHQQNLLFFIASDSQKAKDLMKFKDKDVRIANTTIYHIDRSSVKDDAIIKKGTMDAFVEFMMLSDGECIVRSRSGFSEIPTMLIADNNDGISCSVEFDQCNDNVPIIRE